MIAAARRRKASRDEPQRTPPVCRLMRAKDGEARPSEARTNDKAFPIRRKLDAPGGHNFICRAKRG